MEDTTQKLDATKKRSLFVLIERSIPIDKRGKRKKKASADKAVKEGNTLKSAQDKLLQDHLAKFTKASKVKKSKTRKAKEPRQERDTLERAISISNILGEEEDAAEAETLEPQSIQEALDEYLDQIAEAQIFEDGHSTAATDMGAVNSMEGTMPGQDLAQEFGLGSPSSEGINLDADTLEMSVNSELSTPQHPSDPYITAEEIQPPQDPPLAADMSAKSISKDRSSSRGRDKKKREKTRFDKAREQPDEEEMDHEEANSGSEKSKTNGGAGTKTGKRQRDPPRTGTHDSTTHEDSDDGLPGAKRSMGNIRERLTHAYEKKT